MLKFEDVISNYANMIYNMARRIMGNVHDAQDVAQEVAVKIYRNLANCKGEEFLSAWIARITHNACMDALRRRRGGMASLDEILDLGEGEVAVQLPDPSAGPEQQLIASELAEQIEDALDELAPMYRTLIVLRDVQGHSYEEMADITGLPVGTVKSRLFRGRNRLKQLLMERLCRLETD